MKLLKRYEDLLANMTVVGLAEEMLGFNLMEEKEWQKLEVVDVGEQSTNEMIEELVDYMELNPQKLAKRFKSNRVMV